MVPRAETGVRRRERWTAPILSAFDHDVRFKPGTQAVDAPIYDRRTEFRMETEASKKRKVVWLRVGLVCSIVAYTLLRGQSTVGVAVLACSKVLPILMMLFLSLLLGNTGAYAVCVAAGLGLSAIGDFCLELEGASSSSPHLFEAGLFAFLLGHCAFIAAFLRNPIQPHGPMSVCIPPVYAAAVFYALQPSLPRTLILPVLAYSIAIAAMMTIAFSRAPDGYAALWSWRCAALGAALFAASDTMLAYSRFVRPVPYAKVCVLSSYYLAQYCLTMSARGAQKRPLQKALGSVENFSTCQKGRAADTSH